MDQTTSPQSVSATTIFQLISGTRYVITKSGTIGSATEATLQYLAGDTYVAYPDDTGALDEGYEILTPPSGKICIYLPSAAGTTVVIEFYKVNSH